MRSLRLAPVLLGLMLGFGGGRAAFAGGNCAGTSTGRIPLMDLPPDLYQGEEGGLYPGGVNTRPVAHDQAADRTARIRLRAADGTPDPVGGRIVLLSVGMSNTNQEFATFIQAASPDPVRNTQVVIVNGAQGGWDARRLSDPT